MQNFDRYGVVTLHTNNTIASFQEKRFYASGLINGGVYVLHVAAFLNESLPQKFSFESEYLEKYYNQRKMVGFIQEKYFIDIGIPDDFKKANTDFISFK
jgi:D-glycero-alpha-D-manno-heptose 1-phosphate guanylyltransferase